jgi:aspartyl protease family protein
MTTDQGANVIWYVLAATLVLSALVSRRIPFKSTLLMVLGWTGIFAVALVAFSYHRELGQAARKVGREVTGQAEQHVDGTMLRVNMASDGHYWVDGDINGKKARFLIDSGATITALSRRTALAAGLNIEGGPGIALNTANGTVVAQRSSIARLQVGPVGTGDLPIVVSDTFGEVNVLGMNFLSRLKGWRVENGEMVLQP